MLMRNARLPYHPDSARLFEALAREPWQVAVSVLLIGFQLGNTGVMLAAIRDITPRARLGTIIALFGTSGPVGVAVGPAAAGCRSLPEPSRTEARQTLGRQGSRQ